MHKTIIINGHPLLPKSVSNSIISDEILLLAELNKIESEIQIRNLSGLYPDLIIDKKQEQEILSVADLIILQFPFYWYSVPGLLKLWMDEVLEYGFAYGKTGTKLHGKKLLLSITTGGPEDAYQTNGRNHYEMKDLVVPLIQTSNLIGTTFMGTVISYGMTNIPGIESSLEMITGEAKTHAEKLFQAISTSISK